VIGPLEPIGPPPRDGPLAGLWEFLFPSRCLGCDRRGVVLCADCLPTVPWQGPFVCPRCARASRLGALCRRCLAGREPLLTSVRAACRFEGVIRTAIHRLKYRRASFLAPFLARLLAEALVRRPLEVDLLVPVPLDPARQRERGFNQAALIALELSRCADYPAPTLDLLRRVPHRRPQVGLQAAERRRNVLGAFHCPDPEAVAGRRLLLIDDVMTTGATLEACAAALRSAGAAQVLAAVVAREV
jgi:ComF family protein